MGLGFKIFRGDEPGMGLDDTQPNYPKTYTRLQEPYTNNIPEIFFCIL